MRIDESSVVSIGLIVLCLALLWEIARANWHHSRPGQKPTQAPDSPSQIESHEGKGAQNEG